MSKKRVILHIGTGKAGSTALQRFCFENRHPLENSGYLYPISHASPTGHHAYGHLWGTGTMPIEQRSKLDAGKIWADLRSEIDNSPLDVLMSTESWATAFSQCPQSLKDVRHAFSGMDVSIIVYLRNQVDHAESWYNQKIKSGYAIGDVTDISLLPTFYDYFDFLENIAAVFGKEYVIVRLYDHREFDGGNIFSDFIQALGLDWSSEYIVPDKDENPRLTNRVLDFLIETNSIYRTRQEKVRFNQYILEKFCDRNRDEPAKILDDETRAKIMARYEEQNRLVARNYFARDDEVLFRPIAAKIPKTRVKPLPPLTACEIAIELWRQNEE